MEQKFRVYGMACRMLRLRGYEVKVNGMNRGFLDICPRKYAETKRRLIADGHTGELRKLVGRVTAMYTECFRQFRDKFRKSDVILPDASGRVAVYMEENYHIVKDVIKRAIRRLTSEYPTIEKIIFVAAKMTSQAAKKEYSVKIELFPAKLLKIDPTLHVLTPKQRLLSPAEGQKVLRDLRVTRDKLMKMLSTDPIAIWFGASRGMIFEIRRHDAANSVAKIAYRVVV